MLVVSHSTGENSRTRKQFSLKRFALRTALSTYDALVQKCNFVGVSFLDLLHPDLGPYIYIYIYCKKDNYGLYHLHHKQLVKKTIAVMCF